MIVGLLGWVVDRPDPLVRLARDGETERFLSLLLARRLFYLARPARREAPAAAALPRPAPCLLGARAEICLPLFSSAARAARFLARLGSSGECRVEAAPGVRLIDAIAAHERVTLDPLCRREHPLTEEELTILRTVAERLLLERTPRAS